MKSIIPIPEKTWVLNLYAVGDLRYEQIDLPKITEDEVLIQIKACGICSSDIERCFVNGTYHFPTVPGHEFSGKIVAVGNEKNSNFLGKRAVVFPMLPCFNCDACKEENYAQCHNYSYFGSRQDGGFSEFLVVPIWNIVLIDELLDYKIAALCEPAAVSLHAIDIADIKDGDVVSVVGTGTIAYLISIFAKSKGAKVIMVGKSSDKLSLAKELGIFCCLTKDFSKTIKKFTGKEYATKSFEVVGTNESLTTAIQTVGDNGLVVLIGNPKQNAELDKNVYWKILRKELTIKGSWNSSYKKDKNNWIEALKHFSKLQKDIEKLITKTYSLEKFKDAFEFLMNKDTVKTKIMFTNGD